MKKISKKIQAFVIAICLLFSTLPLTAKAQNNDSVNRYTVLVLDTSASADFLDSDGNVMYTADTAIDYVKRASKKFLSDVTEASGNNYVALVSYKSGAEVVSQFTQDITTINNSIDSLSASGTTRSIAAGLSSADSLLEKVTDENAIKNVVIFTTGMTNEGDYNYTGHYNEETVGSEWKRTDTDVRLYAYANVAIEKAQNIKDNGGKVYSIGLFQTMDGMPENGKAVVEFFKLTAKDLASGSDYFYSVDDPDDLEIVFGEVADDVVSGEKNSSSAVKKYNGHFYQVYDVSMNWKEAKSYCESMGGHLLTINDKNEQEFINSLALKRTDYWLGGTDEESEGTWRWITGEPWKYENWHYNQPDNDMDTENYLVLVTSWDNEWNDAPLDGANSNMGFICEWETKYVLKPKQVWGFEQTTITDKLNMSDYMRFYNPAHAAILLFADNGSGGYCNGMATSVNALAIYGDEKTKSFLLNDGTTSTCLSQVKSNQLKNSTTLRTAASYVKYAHTYQHKFSVQKEYWANINQLDKLYQAIKNSVENSGEPVEIGIRGNLGTDIDGHTLLVTGISYENSQEMEILVYDGNFSTEYQKFYLYKEDGNVTSWKYQIDNFLDWGTGKPNNQITYTTQGEEVSKVLPKKLVEDISDSMKYMLSVKNKDSVIGTSSGNYSLKDSENNTIIPIYTSNGTGGSDKNIYWIDTTDDISIRNSNQDNDIQIAANSKTVSADIPANASVSANLNNSDLKADINGLSSEKDFSVTLAQYTENAEVSSVTVTGTSDIGTVTVQKENGNKVNVNGANHAEVQFQNEDGSKTEKVKIDLGGKPSQIEQTSDKTTVKQDTDDNGTYDKVVYESRKKVSTPKLGKVTSGYNSLKVSWKKVSKASGYRVYRKVNGGKWKSIKYVTGTSYTDKSVKAGNTYTYTVKAYQNVNGKKVFSGYNKKGVSGKLTTSISLKTKSKKVVVNWKKTTGASGYYVYRASSGKGKYSKIKTISSGKTLKYTDGKVKKGKTYYYKVVPYGKKGKKTVKCNASAVKKIKVK